MDNPIDFYSDKKLYSTDNQQITVANIFFLFFLSLIPLFTQWVIVSHVALTPVIGYDIVYLMVSLFYIFTFRLVIEVSSPEDAKHLSERMRINVIIDHNNPGLHLLY